MRAQLKNAKLTSIEILNINMQGEMRTQLKNAKLVSIEIVNTNMQGEMRAQLKNAKLSSARDVREQRNKDRVEIAVAQKKMTTPRHEDDDGMNDRFVC